MDKKKDKTLRIFVKVIEDQESDGIAIECTNPKETIQDFLSRIKRAHSEWAAYS